MLHLLPPVVLHSYRKLSLRFHPVKNESVGAEEKFTEIAEAYDILSDRKSCKTHVLAIH